MLPNPKDVAVAWSGRTFYGSVEDTRNQMADLIRRDRAAVIAEAKRVVERQFREDTGAIGPRLGILDALDAILKEQP